MKEKAGHDNVGIDRDDMAIDGTLFTYIQKKILIKKKSVGLNSELGSW